ncbi:MAG: aryl-sulfate sulfotransferase, partial [Taibaiella sp.]|nr:aryl-sulfate sulfotransferase [Taibaiella sp.]
MTNSFLIIILFTFSFWIAEGQTRPLNGDSLHYRLVGFEVPRKAKATSYILEVYKAAGTTCILRSEHPGNRITAILPAFGETYTWRVKYIKRKRAIDSTAFFTLTIRDNPRADTTATKLKVLNAASGFKDLFIFLDNTRTLYNLDGEPLWFIPPIAGITDKQYQIRDLKLTSANTITFLASDAYACEIDYHGKLLWRAPDDGRISGAKTEYYHHELTRLANGNYMVAGNKYIDRPWPAGLDTGIKQNRNIIVGADSLYTKVEIGTIIEYDPAGNIVWSWESGNYLVNADLFTLLPDTSILTDSHLNAFYFDEVCSMIYASFRDIDRVVKIHYPSGKVVAEYGCRYYDNEKIKGDGLFYGQHACTTDANGNLMLYNNNVTKRVAGKTGKASSVILLKEPGNDNGDLQKIWEYGCDIDTFAGHITYQGGNALELMDGNYLVGMGTAGRVFIVSKEKKLLWNAVFEKRDVRKQLMPPIYRVSPVY